MKPLTLLVMAWRTMRTWFLESLMVILGVALAVGVTAAALGVAFFYRGATAPTLSTLEMIAQPSQGPGSPKGDFAPFFRVDEHGVPVAYLKLSDIEAAEAACPDVEFGYVQMTAMMSKDGNGVAISMGGGGKGMPGEFANADVAVLVGGDYFEAARLHVERGSGFSATEEQAGAKVAVLGSELARTRYPSVNPVGETIQVLGESFRIIGVLAPAGDAGAFNGPASRDSAAFVPLIASRIYQKMRNPPELTFAARSVDVVGRAATELQGYFDSASGAGAVSVQSSLAKVEESRRQTAGVLFVIAVLAAAGLLIAALNILNLMIARVLRRSKSMAIAVSLGATRARLFLQSLLESGLLSVLGGVLGVGLAVLLSVLLRQLLANAGAPEPFHVDAATISLAFIFTVVVNVLFGLYPALLSSRSNVSDSLKAE